MTRVDALRVVADDLSGAAECAAALAAAAGTAVPLLLSESLPEAGSYVVDTDTRAVPTGPAAAASARMLQRAAGAGPERVQLFKKIDSTLRGHLAAELQAVLAVPGLVDAAVVCPALPEQGRSLRGGLLHVRGELQRDAAGAAIDLCRILRGGGTDPVLMEDGARGSAAELAAVLEATFARGSRLLVVDASDAADLQRLAGALLRWDNRRVLAAGAAGLVKALAAEDLGPLREGVPRLPPASAGPVIAFVGSFSPVSAAQVRELSGEPRIQVFRLAAGEWLAGSACAPVAAAMRQAHAAADQGRNVVFTTSDAPSGAFTRGLVQAMAAAGEPLVRTAGTLVLTGGDTARSVLDRLGVQRVHVFGEFEPGICISRTARGNSPFVVTKAGGFGDAGSLLRVMRHFDSLRSGAPSESS